MPVVGGVCVCVPTKTAYRIHAIKDIVARALPTVRYSHTYPVDGIPVEIAQHISTPKQDET